MNLAEWRATTVPIHEQLPINFNTNAKLHAFRSECSKCNHDIAPDDLRGEIRFHDTFVEIEAFGYCESCNILTPVRYDVWDDLSLVGRSPTSGNISVWTK